MMKKKAEYRSSVRSRRLIREAFMELLGEKKFQSITVTDIVNRADINRGTFYAHYADTRAIVEEIEQELIDQMTESFQGFEYQDFFRNPLPVLTHLVEWMQTSMERYRALLESTLSEEIFGKLQRVFYEHMAADSTIPEDVKSAPRFRLQIQFFVGGTISLYQSLYRGELEMTPEEIIFEISRLIQGDADLIYN